MLASRRGILLGLGSLIAAPAVVHAASLMPVKGWVMPKQKFWAVSATRPKHPQQDVVTLYVTDMDKKTHNTYIVPREFGGWYPSADEGSFRIQKHDPIESFKMIHDCMPIEVKVPMWYEVKTIA